MTIRCRLTNVLLAGEPAMKWLPPERPPVDFPDGPGARRLRLVEPAPGNPADPVEVIRFKPDAPVWQVPRLFAVSAAVAVFGLLFSADTEARPVSEEELVRLQREREMLETLRRRYQFNEEEVPPWLRDALALIALQLEVAKSAVAASLPDAGSNHRSDIVNSTDPATTPAPSEFSPGTPEEWQRYLRHLARANGDDPETDPIWSALHFKVIYNEMDDRQTLVLMLERSAVAIALEHLRYTWQGPDGKLLYIAKIVRQLFGISEIAARHHIDFKTVAPLSGEMKRFVNWAGSLEQELFYGKNDEEPRGIYPSDLEHMTDILVHAGRYLAGEQVRTDRDLGQVMLHNARDRYKETERLYRDEGKDVEARAIGALIKEANLAPGVSRRARDRFINAMYVSAVRTLQMALQNWAHRQEFKEDIQQMVRSLAEDRVVLARFGLYEIAWLGLYHLSRLADVLGLLKTAEELMDQADQVYELGHGLGVISDKMTVEADLLFSGVIRGANNPGASASDRRIGLFPVPEAYADSAQGAGDPFAHEAVDGRGLDSRWSKLDRTVGPLFREEAQDVTRWGSPASQPAALPKTHIGEMIRTIELRTAAIKREIIARMNRSDSPQVILDWLQNTIRPELERLWEGVKTHADKLAWRNTLHDVRHDLVDILSGVTAMLEDHDLDRARRFCEIRDYHSMGDMMTALEAAFAGDLKIYMPGLIYLRMNDHVNTGALKSILTNLLRNAAEHPGPEGIPVAVNIRVDGKLLMIRDFGAGMSADALDNIRQGVRIHNGKPVGNNNDSFYGSGWESIRNNCNLLGIRWKIDSVLDEGTTVTLTLPEGLLK